MSKSKLNKRQLKKISRIAAEHILRNNEHVSRDQLFFDFNNEEEMHGEFGFWQRGWGYDDDYSSYSALDALLEDFIDCFINYREMDEEDAPMRVAPPREFRSLSFANAVHYMIKFLEGK